MRVARMRTCSHSAISAASTGFAAAAAECAESSIPVSAGTSVGVEPGDTSAAHASSTIKAMCADSAVSPGRATEEVSRDRLSSDSSAGTSRVTWSCSRLQLPSSPLATVASAGAASDVASATGAALSKALASARSHGSSSCSSASRSSTVRMRK